MGGHAVTVEMLQPNLAAGAPGNADGTINLVHYAAWLDWGMGNRVLSATGHDEASCAGS